MVTSRICSHTHIIGECTSSRHVQPCSLHDAVWCHMSFFWHYIKPHKWDPVSSIGKMCLLWYNLITWYIYLYKFCVFFPPNTESRLGSRSSHHHLCTWKIHRLLQAFHEHGHQHFVSQTQYYQQWLLLLPEPHDSRHMGLHPPGLPGC